MILRIGSVTVDAGLGFQSRAVFQAVAGYRPGSTQPGNIALIDDVAAVLTGARAHINDVIGCCDDTRMVFYNQDRVAGVAQLEQQGVHAFDVGGVQPGGGFIKT